ncbi:MAG: hypothetical protein IT384_02400 [Deltaproteobacteria bacterium]|nr:hypothetical protein [Deltaproteobacteria bacterium]
MSLGSARAASQKGAALFLLTVSVGAWPGTAGAFEIMKTSSGAELSWWAQPVPYGAAFVIGDPAGERFGAACRRAADRWSAAESGVVELDYRGADREALDGDRASTLAVVDAWDPAFGDPARVVAFTLQKFETDTGSISEADILLNGEAFEFADAVPGAYDTESVILHELGHLLGFGHSCGDRGGQLPSCFSIPDDPPGLRDRVLGAVMAPTLAPGVSRRTLGDDDLDALAASYPGQRAGALPRIDAIARACPAELVWIRGELPESVSVTLRFSDGTRAAAPILQRDAGAVAIDASPLDQASSADLMLAVPGATRRAIAVAVRLPAPVCEGPPNPPPPDPGGCTCQDVEGGELALWALLPLAGWVRRRR